jgi:hypothetical protein
MVRNLSMPVNLAIQARTYTLLALDQLHEAKEFLTAFIENTADDNDRARVIEDLAVIDCLIDANTPLPELPPQIANELQRLSLFKSAVETLNSAAKKHFG